MTDKNTDEEKIKRFEGDISQVIEELKRAYAEINRLKEENRRLRSK